MSQPLWLCDVTTQPVAYKDCLACAEAGAVPACHFAVPGLLKALARTMEDDPALAAVKSLGIPVVRVSSLTGCVRQPWYERTQGYPLETPGRLWARLRGTIFHAGLENGGAGEERRLVHLLDLGDGQKAIVAGRVDHYADATLTDYKTVNAVYKKLDELDLPKRHHRRQLALYCWLIWRALGERVQRAQLIYLTMGDVRRVDVPVPDEEVLARIEAVVVERVRAIIGDEAPRGNPSEPWECRYCAFRRGCPDRI